MMDDIGQMYSAYDEIEYWKDCANFWQGQYWHMIDYWKKIYPEIINVRNKFIKRDDDEL